MKTDSLSCKSIIPYSNCLPKLFLVPAAKCNASRSSESISMILSSLIYSKAIMKESKLSVESRSAGGCNFSYSVKLTFFAQKLVKNSNTSKSVFPLN